MSHSTDRFITRMKLTELNRQRERLRESYHAIAASAEAAESDVARLSALFRGLADVQFAGAPLHPAVSHVKLLPGAMDTRAVGPAVQKLWLNRLQEELRRGQLRSEIVYLFGALLEEWTRREPALTKRQQQAATEAERIIKFVTRPADVTEELINELLDDVFSGLDEELEELGPRLSETIDEADELTPAHLSVLLSEIHEDDCQSAELRDEALSFKSDKNLNKDLQDALNLTLADVDHWRHAEAGYSVEAVWTRNKWRMYPRFDLPTAALLRHMEGRWRRAFHKCIGEDYDRSLRQARIAKLKDLGAPDVILQNEYRMLKLAEERISLSVGLVEPWSEFETDADETIEPVSGSVFAQRERWQEQVRDSVSNRGYGIYGSDNPVVALANTEIRVLRHAFPDVSLYVLKVDLEDFYPSIPHELITGILQRLGVEERHVEFVLRFLQLPIRRNRNQAAVARRGVPMGCVLSDVLANLVLTLLERFVQQQAAVRIIRQIDDMFILAPAPDAVDTAWRRISKFCESTGLAVNRAKCGTVCIGGGTVPEAAPAGRPAWGMLVLDDDGEWTVSDAVFRSHLEQTRDHVDATTGLLSKIQVYNVNARFLLSNLCCSNRLGDRHRSAVFAAVRRFHLEFTNRGGSFAGELAAELRRRFQLPDSLHVPESWIYWPVTAGGLGLFNPLIELSQYADDADDAEDVEFPSKKEPGWDRLENKWGKVYEKLMSSIRPAELEQSPEMQAQINDFIQRGKEISGGRQHNLSPYWQWVLAIFGPEILDSFGTFRFLITELVPLRLINRQLSGGGSHDGDGDD